MTDFSTAFILLCIFAVVITVWGIASGDGVFEMPVLISTFIIAWLIPQGIAAETQSFGVSSADEKFWSYVLLCFLSLTAAFYFAKNPRGKARVAARVVRGDDETYDYQKLLVVTVLLLAVGIFGQIMVERLAPEQETGEWTGIISAYYMLIDLRTFVICLAVLLYARTRRTSFLILALVGLAISVPGLLSSVKRGMIFETLVASVGAYMFAKRIIPPRVAVIAFVLAGTLLLHQVGLLRQAYAEGRSVASVISSGEFFDSFEYFELDKAHEVLQAKSDFIYVDRNDSYTLGADYWNQVSHQYVPGFLFGSDFKQSLKFPTVRELAREGEGGLYSSIGATRTGFSDSYESFWFFGALVFLLMGYVSGVLYRKARAGNLQAQFFYLTFIGPYLVAISHSTSAMVAAMPFILMVMLPAFYLSKRRNVARPRRTSNLTLARNRAVFRERQRTRQAEA